MNPTVTTFPPPQPDSRGEALQSLHRAPEPRLVSELLPLASLEPVQRAAAQTQARALVEALRGAPRLGAQAARVQSLMQEYALSSDEGVALMCLAEALLRIPDDATRDALIRDKIGQGDWQRHVGQSPSWFVNAASWALLLTGKLVATHSEGRLRASLERMVARSGEPLIRKGVDLAMRMLGEQFVTGQTIAQALHRARHNEARGFSYSYDMLGEAALTQGDAEHYARAYENAIHAIGAAAQGRGIYSGPGISVKLSALHPRYCRAQRERVLAELVPRLLHLAELARGYDIGLNIDAEEADRLELSLEVLGALCEHAPLARWGGIGFVVQAYQKRCLAVVQQVIALARRTGHRLMVRLVKGAYWDSEIKRAQVDGMSDYPVFTRKHHTDLAYLACARTLLAAPDAVYPQFATHNAYTVAAVLQMAGPKFAPGDYEFQCLHGMGEPLYEHVVGSAALDRPCRIYAPVGTHETLLAYLVRRLLENGANSSFVNQLSDPKVPPEALVQDPAQQVCQRAERSAGVLGAAHPAIALPGSLFGAQRRNSRGLDLADDGVLHQLALWLGQSRGQAWLAEPMPLRATPAQAQAGALRNPADHSDVVGHVQHASAEQVANAVQAAQQASAAWAATSPAHRADVLERAAELLEADHASLLPLLVREAGKTWAHAVAELREAADFLRYYGAQVRQGWHASTHVPLGPVVCISPWNFPLAIFMGQVSAALAAGNTVLAKPAEQTPLVAARAVHILWQAGVAQDVLQLLPGVGREVGMQLVRDERVQGVLFTGSTETARSIRTALAERGGNCVFLGETGGQNAMFVDSSALLEQVALDVVSSAFEAAGQRCSALRVLCVQDDVADRLIELMKGATAQCRVGNPALLHTDCGPVIDERAKAGIEAHLRRMASLGFAITPCAWGQADELPRGTYCSPTLIEIDSISRLEREVFGPVLHVLRYAREDLAATVEAVNATGYALTLGVHSRIEETIAQVLKLGRAGNVYVNRNMVGAVVGVQPFGGEGLSGTGPKAGGPLYLLRLLRQRPGAAVLEALRGAGAAALPVASAALESLHDWAVAQGLLPLAHLCARLAASSPAGWMTALPGPTGERNLYTVQARERVLCLGGPEADMHLLRQLAAVLAVGGTALWPASAAALRESLPARAQDCIELDSAVGGDDGSEAGVGAKAAPTAALFHGDAAGIRAVQLKLAQRPGPLVTLGATTAENPDPDLLLLLRERSLCTNTAAAGGNANLMTLEDPSV